MRISDWSSDVCSSDLPADVQRGQLGVVGPVAHRAVELGREDGLLPAAAALGEPPADDVLGDALAELPPVDVGGVEEVDPQLKEIGRASCRERACQYV